MEIIETEAQRVIPGCFKNIPLYGDALKTTTQQKVDMYA